MEKILVTGYNGLIGSSLVNELLKNSNYEIIGVGRSKNKLIETIEIDLSTDWSVEKLPMKVDVIIHLAQSEFFRDFPAKAKDIFYTNTLSTSKLADYAVKAGAKKFIYASSGGIYGNRDKAFEESDNLPVSNLGFYLGSKLCSEIILDNYKSLLNVQLLRFFFVYGKRQNKSMLIPRLVNRVKNGETIQLDGSDGLRINPIYVDDAVAAIIASMSISESNHYNIAGSEVFSLKEICEIIGNIVSKKPVFEFKPNKAANLIADISKMEEKLVDPKLKFIDGIKKIIE